MVVRASQECYGVWFWKSTLVGSRVTQCSSTPIVYDFEAGTRQITRMPARDWFPMPLPLEQFLSAVLLRIFSIQSFEPSAVFSLRDVRPNFCLATMPSKSNSQTR